MSANAPLAIYLHWPYCARICPYCDFNVYLDKRAGEAEALIDAMVQDLAYWRDWTGARQIGSVHFGGGTPSLLTRSQLSTVLEAIDRQWGLMKRTEIALEANPNAASVDKIADWQAAGLTRLSLGVQSFDDAVLKRLGRDHDGAQAREAVAMAAQAFRSVSADLIFGVAGEAQGRLAADLDALQDLGVPHISTYQLTIEPGTAFARDAARGTDHAVGDDDSAASMAYIDAQLTQAGYGHYEISNYARPGHESQHNLAYWRGEDYVGVGPGAHGRLWTGAGRVATETARKPADYIAAVGADQTAIVSRETLSPAQAAEEYVLMGLRIEEGLSLSRLAQIKGGPIQIDPHLIEDGYLQVQGERLRATDRGRPVLDALTRALLV